METLFIIIIAIAVGAAVIWVFRLLFLFAIGILVISAVVFVSNMYKDHAKDNFLQQCYQYQSHQACARLWDAKN